MQQNRAVSYIANPIINVKMYMWGWLLYKKGRLATRLLFLKAVSYSMETGSNGQSADGLYNGADGLPVVE